MAKSKSGDVIFHRGKNADNEDIWDDSALIAAYEQAANLAYDAVRANMESNGEYTAEDLMKHGIRATESRERNNSIAGNSSASGNRSASKKSRRKRSSQRKKWQVGDRCLAKYSEDDAWYEATVIAIDRAHNRCTVRYTSYENEEDVNLGMLKKCPETSYDEEASSKSDGDGDGELEDGSEASKSVLGNRRSFDSGPMLPPPVPPHLLHNRDGIPQEDEAVAAMLMSWYTSGYHTGYYQAMRDMKRSSK